MNTLYYGDNLEILKNRIAAEIVDLIYLDPPFQSGKNYNQIFTPQAGEVRGATAQIQAFGDTWTWGPEADREYTELIAGRITTEPPTQKLIDLMKAMRGYLRDCSLMAYLCMMAPRLVEMRRTLKPTGSIYLHCDPTASHYLKLLMDGVFGAGSFRSEIVWKRSSAHSDAAQGRVQHGRIHDVILFYTKTDKWAWNTLYTPYDQEYIDQFYKHIEPETGRRYQMDNLTAAKPGGDTGYEWRVKRQQGADKPPFFFGDPVSTGISFRERTGTNCPYSSA